MNKIIILGASGHSKVLIDIIEQQNHFQIVGLIDRPEKVGQNLLTYKVIGTDEDLGNLLTHHSVDTIAIGIGDNFIRSLVFAKTAQKFPNIKFATLIHPKAYVATSAKIGAGSVIMPGAVVGSDCFVGDHCIVNTNSSLDHDSSMGNFSSLAPNSATGGNCQIGEQAVLGIGATLSNGLSIGVHSVVGAGSVVLHDVPEYSLAYGVPARTIRNRKAGEAYL